MLDFELFKEAVADAARRTLGEKGTVETDMVQTRGGTHRPVLRTVQEKDGKREEMLIFLDELYEECEGDAPLPEELKKKGAHTGNRAFMEKVLDLSGKLPDGLSRWQDVKEKVYPLLLPQGRLPDIPDVPAPFEGCSVSVVCAIRIKMTPQTWRMPVVVTPAMIKKLGITQKILYRTAQENLARDGCRAISLRKQVFAITCGDDAEPEEIQGMLIPGDQYVLSNGSGFWGAATLLHVGLLKRLSGGQDLYILPSSVHETIQLVDDGRMAQEDLDNLVKGANRTEIIQQEMLGDGSFFYDGKTGKIRRYREKPAEAETDGGEDCQKELELQKYEP